MTAPDPVQRLRDALTDFGYAKAAGVLTHPQRLATAAQELVDALPAMLQAAKAEAWDEGQSAGVEAGTYGDGPSNPYRNAAADELPKKDSGDAASTGPTTDKTSE